MAQKYSQELITDIKDLVSERMDELKAMDREEINREFQDKVGVEPHPRFHLDLMIKMIARVYQGELWTEKTGDIPAEIRKKDMEFWFRMEAYFTPKAAIREERAKPVVAKAKKKKTNQTQSTKSLPGSSGTGLQSKAKNLEDSTLCMIGEPDGKNHDIIMAVENILQTAPDKMMEYPLFATQCKKKKINTPPHMLALLMKRLGVIEISYPNEPEPVVVEQVQEEPEDDGVDFNDVLKSVEEEAPKLLVETKCVDFGHGEKVNDY